MHVLVVLLHVEVLCLHHAGLYALFTKEFYQRLVFRQSLVNAVKQQRTLFPHLTVVRLHLLFCLGKHLHKHLLLCFHQAHNLTLQLSEQLVIAFWHRTGDDKRCTCIIDQHRVHLIDNGIVVCPLNQVIGRNCHIVTQVVETKFVVRSVSDVCLICFPALR